MSTETNDIYNDQTDENCEEEQTSIKKWWLEDKWPRIRHWLCEGSFWKEKSKYAKFVEKEYQECLKREKMRNTKNKTQEEDEL